MAIPHERLLSRKLWLKVHLCLALTLGLPFAFMGLSGGALMFREDLDEWLNPGLVVERPGDAYLPPDRLMAAARAAHPSRHDEWVLEAPRSPRAMATAWYEKPHETFGEGYAPLMVSINPYTAEVVANRFWGHTFATRLFKLHTELLMGRTGAAWVGWIGLALGISALSGLWLWAPALRDVRSLFKVRMDSGICRLALDLHRLIGPFAAIPLLILAITGVHLAWPGFLEKLAGASGMGHGEVGTEIRGAAVPNDRPVKLAEAAVIARGLFPHAEVKRIATPVGETGTYRVNLRQQGEENLKHPATWVWIDRWSGQILEVRNSRQLTAGQKLVAGIWPLHTGESLGAAGRGFWSLSALFPLALFVTGTMQWLARKGWLRDRPVDFSALRQGREKILNCLRALCMVLALHLPRILRWIRQQSLRAADWAKRRYMGA
jgi:uncharacterized iron-regulated membrane protein